MSGGGQVSKVNEAEAQYWSLSKGWRLDDSTRILGFDCGGQQWVLEVRRHHGLAEAATEVPVGGRSGS